MKLKRFLAAVLSVCILLGVAAPGMTASGTTIEDIAFNLLDGSQFDIDLTLGGVKGEQDLGIDQIADDEPVKIIIIMESQSVVEEDGSAVYGADTQAMMDSLEAQQSEVIARIEDAVLDGQSLDVSYSYTWLLNGVAAEVPYGLIGQIAQISGVKQVLLQPRYEVCESNYSSAADLFTVSDGTMIGRENTWANGYTGKGIKIAIIDTGLDDDHQNFQALGDDKLTASSATAETVGAVLERLNASSRLTGLTAADVYRSTKVAFGFNYVDNNLDITHDNDTMGDHGTHVAGIAAANKVDGSDVVGVAPDAQLYIMKVYGYDHGGYAEDILAALEDALILGADVINMSLGTNAGFTSSTEEVNAIYDRVAQTNTVLSVSAGNNYTAGYGNTWGTDANLTTNPDNAVIGEPAVYRNVLSIASVENWFIQRNYIAVGDKKLAYVETSSSYDLPSVLTLAGEYGLVAVPNYGAAEDFEGLDLTGKIALVQRGVESFVTKCENAAAAGAIACIVYNNAEGEFGMDLTGCTAEIPCISITMEDGALLLAGLEEDPAMTVSFPEELAALPNLSGYEISDFSSWGVAPDLSLEPDITAPGGNIYSTLTDGEYGLMSGTSMAAPNVSGISALVMQYVKENYPDAQISVRELVQNLLVSTAAPLVYDEESGLYYSPRQQGSGLANAFDAICTWVYLTVDGSDTPKAELGEDAEKTGHYSFTFDVSNLGKTAAFYSLATAVQTEGYAEVEGYEGLYFMSGSPLALSAATSESSGGLVLRYDISGDGAADHQDAYLVYLAATGKAEGWEDASFRYDLNGDDTATTDDVQEYLNALVGLDSAADLEETVLQVEAGQTASVTVSIDLTDEDRAYFETYYANGGYVEGYTFLTALNAGGVDLSLPYLAFYGDWDDAPVLDDGFYWDYMEGDEDTVVGNQYINVLWTEFYGSNSSFYPGFNAYLDDEPFDIGHISISPNGDGYIDTIDDIYISLLRNARYLTFRYVDADTGEVYYDQTVEYVSKSAYSSSYGQIIPAVYSWFEGEISMYNFTDAEGNTLKNNTHLLLQVEATGDYEGATPDSWEIPITVDLEAPELLNVSKTEAADGTVSLELTFRDNLSVAAVALLNSNGSDAYYIEGVEDTEFDENGYRNYTVTFDITGITGKLMIVMSDYALNESYYGLNTGGEGAPYGELVGYQYNFYNETYGWIAFDPVGVIEETEEEEQETTEATEATEETEATEPAEPVPVIQQTQITIDEMNFVCAEYVGGYIFAQTETGALYGFRYTDLLADEFDIRGTFITHLENTYHDFAYSYTDGKLYALRAYEEDGWPTTEIYSINLNGVCTDDLTGETLEPYEEVWTYGRGGLYGLCVTVDDAGTIYLLGTDENGDTELWTSYEHRSYGTLFRQAMSLDVPLDYAQSMTWDHNTGKLYWAQFYPTSIYTYDSALYVIDPAAGSYEMIGTMEGETCGLFAPLTEETVASSEIYQNVPVMDEEAVGRPILRTSVVNMNLGGTQALVYDLDPWYTAYRDVVWSSSDESIVTVDELGNISAVGKGTAIVTVANKADESLFTSVTVNVTALSLTIEGVITAQGAGLGNATGTSLYKYELENGISTFGTTEAITAPEEFSGFGLELATSVYARGYIWACEYGNTGMVYKIDPATGVVVDMLMPVDGDMLFGMSYSDKLDAFTAIMDMYLYVDLEMTHEEQQKMLESYDEDAKEFTYHKINMLPYLLAAGGNYVTGENGQGASSEIVMCGVTTITDSYWYENTNTDYLGNETMDEMSYHATQTLVILDNVGRLWYVDEICGLTKASTSWSTTYTSASDPDTYISYYNGYGRDGLIEMANEDGTYTLFHIRSIENTPLTDMFLEGTMPRITYHFSDIEFGGYAPDGAPIFAMSLYDYWNNGTTNVLYLYTPEVTAYDEELGADVLVAQERFYYLGTTGQYNIIASIHSFAVTGGLED